MVRSKGAKSGRASQKRTLDAFAIASAEIGETPAVPPHRLGEQRGASSRRNDGKDGDGSADGGGDSDGNEWRIGEVESGDDSDIDSDDAMGESDEERFEDFAFRGSTGGKKRMKCSGKGKELDLNEGESGGNEDEDMEDEDGEGYIDLSEMLDQNTPVDSEPEDDDSGETKNASAKENQKKRTAPESDDDLGLGDESSDGASEESDDSDDDEGSIELSENEEVAEDPLKLEALESLISSLPNSNDRPAKRARLNDPNEGKTPGEYNLVLPSGSKKLTINDLLPSVSDPALKKSLKLLASEDKTKNKGVPGKLSAPLAKRQQDRVDRAAAYDQAKETLKRWVDTVKHNREADHLHFPLPNAPNAPVVPSKKLVPITPSNSTPLNDFETSISGILKESHMASEKQLQEFEQLATNKLSVEEVQRRTAELRMARELMYREELKAKRIKKIKSKSYHRIKKKERLRQDEAIQAVLAEEREGMPDPEEEMERERKRAEERMSLKHKQSRWAKGVKDSGRAAWDEDARHGAVEMAQRSEDLRRKIEGKGVGSDEESSEDESIDEFDEEGEGDRKKILEEIEKVEGIGNVTSEMGSRLMNMKFMRNAEAVKRKENEAFIRSLKEELEAPERETESDNDDAATTGRMVFKPQTKNPNPLPQKKLERQEFEAPPASDDEEGRAYQDDESDNEEIRFTNKASSNGPQKRSPFVAPKSASNRLNGYQKRDDNDDGAVNPWLSLDSQRNLVRTKAEAVVTGKQEAKGAKVNHKISKARKAATAATAEDSPAVTIDTGLTLKIARRIDPDDEGEADADDPIQLIPTGAKAESQRELVKMAFAGDDVVREFRKEKKQVMEDDDDKVIDQTLPGWGSWAGSGLTKKQRNQNNRRKAVMVTVKGISKDKRKDAKLGNVIISEKRDKKAAIFQPKAPPHPFETKAQYERSLRVPIGQEWTTKSTFQQATTPRVMVKQGRVVEPMAAPFK